MRERRSRPPASGSRFDAVMCPILSLMLRCGAKRSLEGGLQGSRDTLETSFEAAAQHLRMRGFGWDEPVE
ncbi:hypothetical protein ASG52_20265 [Methylobacterium sp. Leaf456]|nr:hypothetical protein ASG52_20265 [Methylobacterium sp. Leaf456]